MKKIIISTGGTGGHVVPAQVLYEHLVDENEVIIVSDKRGINYLNKNKYKTIEIDVPKISKNLIKFLPIMISFIVSIIKSYLFLSKKKAQILITTGGYMSIPISIAAKFLNLKIFLFEPNFVLGRANLFLLNHCDKILTYGKKIKNFPNGKQYKNYIIKPLIKKNIFSSKQKSETKLKKFMILIIGGSQGARKFDNIFCRDLIKLSKKIEIKIFHQTNSKNINKLKKLYFSNRIDSYVFSYTNHLHKIIKKCDFAITRSGASTINELVFLETPFLAVPFPFAKDDHQFFNAKYYVKKNLGWLIRENEIKQDFLYKFITNLIKNKKSLIQKKKNMKKFNRLYEWNENSKKINKLFL